MKLYLYLDAPNEDPPGFSVYGGAITHQYDAFHIRKKEFMWPNEKFVHPDDDRLFYIWHDAYPFSIKSTLPIYKQTKALYGEVLWGCQYR